MPPKLIRRFQTQECIFELKCLIYRYGENPETGHYTFAEINGSECFEISDEKIIEKPTDELAGNAYLLFYEKIMKKD